MSEDDPNLTPSDVQQEIEIPLPGGMPGTMSPRQHRLEVMKSWANIIATTAALLTGIAAVMKPNDPVNKTSYEELKAAAEQNSRANVQAHEDVVALRNYLEGYFKAANIPVALPPVSPYPSASSSSSAYPAPSGGQMKVTIQSSSDAGVPTSVAVIVPAGTAPPLPSLHAKPAEPKLPRYDDLK